MYDTYIQYWKKYEKQYGSQTCLFLMVGKFYELYDIVNKETGEGQTNVKQAVETLGITLTVRKGDGPNGEDCLFAGFPEQSLQKFAALMTRDGWTVVVCNQEKNEKGSVTSRPVARIFSPGTHIEAAGAEAPYLAGVWMEEGNLSFNSPPRFAAAVLDLTTGQIVSYESEAQGQTDIWSSDDLVHFFQIHPPRETVFWWRGAPFTRPNEATLRRRFGLIKGALHLELANKEQEGSMEIPLVRKAFLERVFSARLGLVSIIEQLQLRGKEQTERVLTSLLRFAEEHLPSAIQNLTNHICWSPDSSVYMGNNTLLQLNYISAGTEQSVLGLFQKTLSSLGRRSLRNRLLSPSANPDIIRRHLDEVEFAYTLSPETIKKVETYLRLIHDIARLHRKIVMYTVDSSDILALDQSYSCINNIDVILKDTILDIGDDLRTEFKKYREIFYENLSVEKAKIAQGNPDIYFLPKEKAPKTCELEEKIEENRKKVLECISTISSWVGIPEDSLRLETLDTQTYVITATKTVLNIVKKKLDETNKSTHPYPGISVQIKKASRGSIEFPALEQIHFITLGLRNRLRNAFLEELPSICRELQNKCWAAVERWVAHVDVTLTLAKVAKERGYTKPEILNLEAQDSGVDARGLRHPLLESIQTRIEYVKHDVALGFDESDDSGWLLYGMNASGKSSLMKAIGISVLLAQAGSWVPASTFKLRPFKSILTRILNQDNLWAGLSSFAVEISELRDIFQRADNRSLVLGDELCSGTESISATSLVAAGIQYLHDKSARFVFATHLHGLHSLSEINNLPNLGTWHLRVHYDPVSDTLVYDRTLHKGPGGTLYGLEVARAMHLPYDILKMAHGFRRQLLGEKDDSEIKNSSWNPSLFRKECEICHSKIVRELEVHHIKPRAEANTNKRFEDGSSMNDIRNLIVVCQKCHDKHHTGEIEIHTQKQTSAGPSRDIVVLSSNQIEKSRQSQTTKKLGSKWTEEEMKIIESYIRKYPNLAVSRIAFDLKQQEGITIGDAKLRKLRLLID